MKNMGLNLTTPPQSLDWQKNYLLKQIDVAMKSAPSKVIKNFGESPSKYLTDSHLGDWLREKLLELKPRKKRFGTVVFKIPNGAIFEILNTKQSLGAFKNLVNRKFPTNKSSMACAPKNKLNAPTGKRLGGEGVIYYNEFSPRKERLLEGARNYYNDGWFSDGYYAIKTEKPTFAILEHAPDIRAHIPENGLVPATIIGEFCTGEEDSIPLVHVVSALDKNMVFNAKYVDCVLSKYPNAAILAKDNMLVFRVDGESVGVVMSMVEDMLDLDFFSDRIEEVKNYFKNGVKNRAKAGLFR